MRRLGGGATEKALAAWGERRRAAAVPKAQERQRPKLKEGTSTSTAPAQEEEELLRIAELFLLLLLLILAFSEQSDILHVVRDSEGAAARSPQHKLGRTTPPRGSYRGVQTACSPTA